jgi:hypothetical protein
MGSLCTAFSSTHLFPEAPHIKQHERPLLVKDRIGREMAGQFGPRFRLPRKSQGSFTCRKSVTWDRQLYFPTEGRHDVDFFTQKIRKSATWDRQLYFPPKEGTMWIFSPKKIHKSATWDRQLYFPSEGRHDVDFFTQKIRKSATWDRQLYFPPKEGTMWIFSPEKSNVFEPMILGTRG